MKRIFLLASIAMVITSCGGCDSSTAEGAVDCICDKTDEVDAAIATGDLARMAEISEEMDELKEEIDAHIEAGDYTENEIEKEIAESGCEI